jgi:hypothetical protein
VSQESISFWDFPLNDHTTKAILYKATLTTFFSKRESKPTEGPLFQQADLRNSVYNELNGDLTGRCDNALDLAAFTVLHAVTVLLERSSHPDLEVFRIFEEAISMLVCNDRLR